MKYKFYHSIFSFILLFFIGKQAQSQTISITPYVSVTGASPIDLKNCGDDRMFVVDRAGYIRVINANGTLRATPFLDIHTKISSTGCEEGFLGMSFSPNYKTDRKFYVYYSTKPGAQLYTTAEEYKVSVADTNIADPSSEIQLFLQAQPFCNHKGGNMMFGPDGYLYINLGDGGSGGDPNGNGQNKTTLLGKILRVDISNSSALNPYTSPVSNPFYNDGTPLIKKEIWAYGVRNPWRCSFDRITGDMWVGDVGQDKVEEIDFQVANAVGGRNYGWNITEGDSCYNAATCNKSGITMPVYEYFHNGVSSSITGGYVYRSAQSKSLWGKYIFGDYVNRWIDAFTLNGMGTGGVATLLITPSENVISFGEDRYGDQYILFNNDNTVYKFEDGSSTRQPKAFIVSTTDEGGGIYLLHGLQGRNLTYQWLRNSVPIPGATSPDYTASASGTYTLQVTNSLGFSDISDPFVLGALPVTLHNFLAHRIDNKVQLQWLSGDEQNITGYTILRRSNDENNFSVIGFVSARSNGSNIETQYNFTDSFPVAGKKSFYRLKLQNRDGSFSFSDIRIISPGNGNIYFSFYPNPAKDHVVINVNNVQLPGQLSVYDNSGRLVKHLQLTQQTTTVSLKGFNGMYNIQFIGADGEKFSSEKLVVE